MTDQAPKYTPKPVSQRDGSALQFVNCRAAAAAVGLAYETASSRKPEGAKTSTGATMRSFTTDQQGGTSSADAVQAWQRGYAETLTVRDGRTFDDALADLHVGHLVHLDVWAAAGGGVDSGTAFPGSPTTNDLFYHETDDELYFYNGSVWLSVAQYHMAYSMTDLGLSGAGVSTNSEFGYATLPYKGTDLIYITEFRITTYVSATNNGSNFWTVNFVEWDDGAPASAILQSVSTAADTAANFTMHAVAHNAAIPSDSVGLTCATVETGAAGNLFSLGAEFAFRRIGS